MELTPRRGKECDYETKRGVAEERTFSNIVTNVRVTIFGNSVLSLDRFVDQPKQ
jgi:hypothetical protein